jgi:mRNA interferase RelE/StbE
VKYELVIAPSAERELRTLPPKEFQRVTEKIRRLANDPRPPGSAKLMGRAGMWRIRVGVYRVVYLIADEIRIVRVVRVRHRAKAYENLDRL